MTYSYSQAAQVADMLEAQKPCWVYALFCEDSQGIGYVKIGRSAEPLKRLAGLAYGAPFTALYCGVVCAGTLEQSKRMEWRIHEELDHRRINGEWFSFDFRSEADKKEFQRVCPKSKKGWRFFPLSDLREVNRRASIVAFKTKMKKKRQSLAVGGRFIAARKDAYRELELYGTK